MKTALVIGGTRFFGKRLVGDLLNKGVHVTVATRGNEMDPFGDQVRRITVDREDEAAFEAAIGTDQWDVVYDQICYSPVEARAACRIFRGKAGKYVFTSTLSVYDADHVPLKEEDFDPYTYPINIKKREEAGYAEGKRWAEAVFFQEAEFPVAAVRFPIVLGPDDYTRRLHFHVEHVQEGQCIGFPNLQASMGFISSKEAAQFLSWLGDHELTGPVNACSSGIVTMERLIALIEETVNKSACVERQTEQAHMSPFGVQISWYMDNGKAQEAGFRFKQLNEWLPALVRQLAEEV